MKKELKDERGKRIHPYVPELCEQLRKEEIGRRDFLWTTTMLGVSATAAYAMAGKITGERITPRAMAQEGKMGGTLRFSMEVQEMTDPSTFDWVQKSNQARHVVEYLTETGPDNITRPYLLESWEASDDLKTWTLNLRQGVKWNNGDDFTAEDVAFNFERWLDPATGSSNIGLFAAMVEETSDGNKKMTSGAVEKVDDHTVRLNLNSAVLAIPENLFNYPTAILHRKFEEMGSDLSKNPIGTGPYELVDFAVGERAILRRRDGYWGKAPFLDEIHYIDTGQDPSARIAALASGQVDGIYEIDVTQIDVLDRVPNAVVHEAVTAQTAVARMQVDQEPFTDPKVRQALVACMDHQKLLDISYRGRGAPAENHHVSPIHPEYAELPPLPHPDIEKAKQLLSEAGFADGIELSIDVGQTSGAWELACIQALKQQCAPAGINLQINNLPSAQYWEIWDKTPFGFTSWTHRPLGVMVLNLGYRSGVPWNESHYANPAFDAALDEASSILDVNERRKVMAKVQKILQDDAVIAQPLWRAVFSATSDKVMGYRTHPTLYHTLLHRVWLA